MPKIITTEAFVQTAREIHGNRYDYARTEYKAARQKAVFICRIHGEYTQTPNAHLRGQNCPKCGKITKNRKKTTTRDWFLAQAEEAHGDRYDYSKVRYRTVRKDVAIVCREHGEFKQQPQHHLTGHGCPACGRYGFRPDSDAVLYVLTSECSKFIKIGITGHLDQRIAQLTRATPFNFKLIFTFNMPGYAARPAETYTHAQFKNAGFSDFDGATEWLHADEHALNHVALACGHGLDKTR